MPPQKTPTKTRPEVRAPRKTGTAGAKPQAPAGHDRPSPKLAVKGNDSVHSKRANKIARASTGAGVSFNTRVGTIGGGSSSHTVQSGAFNFFSPQLSTDFLELPQSIREKREWYRFYCDTNPIVGQAIDLLTEIPLSKVRLSKPKSENKDLADKSMAFFEIMCSRLKLFRKLLEITHLYWLDGNVYIFAEDDDTDNAEDYKGWNRLVILPPDQVKVTTHSFTDEVDIEFIPSDVDRRTAMGVEQNDPVAIKRSDKIPEEIRDHIKEGRNIPLDTDPSTGSFCYHLSRSRRPWEEMGSSILERCLRTLLFADKLRQAQTSIASRNMTPKRVVWGENLDETQIDELREQVDLAIMDPDFSIVANYQVNWEEFGSNDRLLDLSSEYEIVERHLMIGLGVTMELLTGEGTYSGNRLSLEVMNTRFLLYREIIQDYVEEYLFKPVAIRKGFVEKDKWGNVHAVYPKLKFNRMALQDNQETFEALLNLYQKGSLTIDFILDLFNIDAAEVEEKLKRDFGTLNDSNFNEAVRNALGDIGTRLSTDTDLFDKVVEHLGLKIMAKEEDRFNE